MIKQVSQSFSWQHFARLLFLHRRKAGMYGLFFVVVSFNLCLFLPANMHTPAAERIVNIIQLLCFLIMGIANVWIFYKRNFLAELALSGAKLAFISLLFIVIALVLFVYYYVTGNNGLIMAFASSGAFLLPFLLYHGWVAFMDIPAKSYPVWYLPEMATPYTTTTVHSMQVQLQLLRTTGDAQTLSFPVTASGKLKLGRLFERFIADRQLHGSKKEIQVKDNQQQSFGWQFYEEKWFGLYSRNLNASKSLLENNVKPNAKIIAVRIIQK